MVRKEKTNETTPWGVKKKVIKESAFRLMEQIILAHLTAKYTVFL